jgi:AmmeMemoRadiSam system protein B
MQVRNPAVAGSFYPENSEELNQMIKNFLGKLEPKRRMCMGAVVPHAGYEFCGKTAASVYLNVSTGFETAVILGPNHSGAGVGVATSLETWKTPLGNVEIDKDFVEELTRDSIITEDPKSHLHEHSIEVQLPWLQYRFKEFKIVPIAINPIYFDVKTCREIGEKIAEIVKGLRRKTLIIASSDFTHYGAAYSYEPFEGSEDEILRKIKETDYEVIKLINNLKASEVIEMCDEKRLTICGYGGIAAMLFAVKELGAKKGELMNYSTSFDVSHDSDAVVGYAGVTIS